MKLTLLIAVAATSLLSQCFGKPAADASPEPAPVDVTAPAPAPAGDATNTAGNVQEQPAPPAGS